MNSDNRIKDNMVEMIAKLFAEDGLSRRAFWDPDTMDRMGEEFWVWVWNVR